MTRLVLGLCLGLLVAVAGPLAMAAPTFPNLTGRVVDDAGVLSDTTEAELTKASEALEAATGRQFVVATVRSLDGMEIEDYSILLARHWKIGREKEDDGVVLLVAPNQRKVRIEVGYGLESVLSNDAAKAIIDDKIIPRFKAGQIDAGVLAGGQAITARLTPPGAQRLAAPPPAAAGAASAPAAAPAAASTTTVLLVSAVLVLLFMVIRGRRQQPVMLAQQPMVMPPSGYAPAYGPGFAPSYGPAYGYGGYYPGGPRRGFGSGVATGAAGMYLWDHRNSGSSSGGASYSGGGGDSGGGGGSSSGFSFSSGRSDSNTGHGGGGSFGGGGASGSW